MTMQICLCGARPGQSHRSYCPYPYYGNDENLIWVWERNRERLLGELVTSDRVIEGLMVDLRKEVEKR